MSKIKEYANEVLGGDDGVANFDVDQRSEDAEE